eukprot:scaffold10197_cov270-Chaetoceros_neogracile.AAC.2
MATSLAVYYFEQAVASTLISRGTRNLHDCWCRRLPRRCRSSLKTVSMGTMRPQGLTIVFTH